MKKNVSFFLLCVFVLFTSCSDFFDNGIEEIAPNLDENGVDVSYVTGDGSTKIRFNNNSGDNRKGDFPVRVYRDSGRSSLIAEIPTQSTSKEIEWYAGSSSNFFVSYVFLIAGIEIEYRPPSTTGQIIYGRIDQGETATVTIPSLLSGDRIPGEDIDAKNAYPLTKDIYLKITNNSGVAVKTLKGINTVFPIRIEQPDGSTKPGGNSWLNDGDTALFQIKGAANENASSYVIEKDGDNKSFPAEIAEFETGTIYDFTIDESGLIAFVDDIKITLENADTSKNVNFGNDIWDGESTSTIPLVNNDWSQRSLSSFGEKHYFVFPVEAGQDYYVQWNDADIGDKTGKADIRVSAYYSNSTSTKPFSLEDKGYLDTDIQKITALFGGYIYITVRGYYGNESGSYEIRYYCPSLSTSLSPDAPTGVEAEADTSTSIIVSWNSVTGGNPATGYNVYEAVGANGQYIKLNTTPITGTSTRVTGLSAGATRYYKVTAINESGESAKSSYAYATTPTATVSAPTGVTATALSSNSIRITWNVPNDSYQYYLYRSTSLSGTFTQVADSIFGLGSSAAYTDTGLSSNTTYYYKVRVLQFYGDTLSDYSATASAKTFGNSAITLTSGFWTNGTMSAGGTQTYKFYATAGTTYHIEWNDSYNGDGTKSGDIKVSAQTASGTTLFSNVDSGYYSGRMVSVTTSQDIIITVQGYFSYSTGTYAIGYY
jgi:hypothetical protein